MNKKTIAILAGLMALAAALAAVIYLRHARRDTELLELLPPELDLYAVADIGILKANPALAKLLSDPANFPHDEDYDRFIRATGFRYEQDLQQIAAGKSGPDWAGAARVTVDRARVVQYLESQGAEKKTIEGQTVYSFGLLRPFRLVFIDDDSNSTASQETKAARVAFTIGGDDSRIRQAIERSHRDLHDSAASELARRNDLAHIRPGAGTWIVARPERLGMASGTEAQVGSLNLNASLLRGSRTIYVTLDATPARVNLQVEDYCDSTASSQRITGSLQGLLALVKAMPAGKGGASAGATPAPNAQSLLDGITVEQSGQSVFVRWQPGEEVLRLLQSNPR